MDKIQKYMKTTIAVLTVIATVLAQLAPIITDPQIKQYVTIALVILGAIGVYAVPNKVPAISASIAGPPPKSR